MGNRNWWSKTWDHGQVTAFSGMFKENYDREFLSFWKSQLIHDYKNCIDVATGNGALVWLINEHLNSDGANVKLTGIDAADIHPFKMLGKKRKDYPMVDFIGNSNIESLPFEDSSIDLVVSQYGIEYSNLELSINEVLRVLKPEGQISLIMHSKDSVVVKPALDIAKECERIICKQPILDLFLDLDKLYNESDTITKEEENLKAKINQQVSDMVLRTKYFPPGNPNFINYVKALEAEFLSTLPRRRKNREKRMLIARSKLQDHQMINQELYDAGLTTHEFSNLVDLIQARGFAVTEKKAITYRDNQKFGYAVSAKGS